MRELVLQTLPKTLLRKTALNLSDGIYALTLADYCVGVETWLRTHVHILSEPEELLIDPALMLSDIAATGQTTGDCDDVAMLAAALLVIIGMPARFVATGRNDDNSYSHVYTQGWAGETWRTIDPTGPEPLTLLPDDLIMEV